MKFMSKEMLNSLCTPSYLYFVISMIFIVLMMIQNMFGKGYTVGMYTCSIENRFHIFLGKIVYVFFWTWVLNKICTLGYKNISWFLLLFPYVWMFILIGLLMVSNDVVTILE